MPFPLPLHLPRPASLVIRFTNSGRFDNAIKLYTEFLGAGPVQSEPGKFASFQVGGALLPKARDMEFRLELHPGDTSDLKGHTLLYWAIDPRDEAAAKELAKKLAYRTEVNTGTEPLAGQQFLLTDGFDNFFGGHTNPPFPPGTPPGPGRGGPQGFLRQPGFVVGLVGGAVLGGVLVAIAQARRG